MQVFVSVREEAKTHRGGELCVEVLIRVCGVEADETVAVFDGQVLACAVPVAEVVAGRVVEGVDDEGVGCVVEGLDGWEGGRDWGEGVGGDGLGLDAPRD